MDLCYGELLMIYFHSVSIVLEYLWQAVLVYMRAYYIDSPLHRKHLDQYQASSVSV